MTRIRSSFLICSALGLAGCGGGHHSDPVRFADPPPPTIPVDSRAYTPPAPCDRSPLQAPWHIPTFANSEQRREFTMTTNILGHHTSNPLCHLLQLAQQPTVPALKEPTRATVLVNLARISCPGDPRACGLPKAYDEYARLVKNLESVGEASALAIDPEWKRVDLGVVNLEEEFTFADQPDAALQLRDLLLAEAAVEHALSTSAPWLRGWSGDAGEEDLGASAVGEFFAGYPMFAFRAFLHALACPDETNPLKLNTCRLRRDVAHLALVEVFERMRARRERAVATKHTLTDTEARPAFHRLKTIEEIAETRERIAELLRKGTSIEMARKSSDGDALLEQVRTVLATPFDASARDVYRALGEIHAFSALEREVDRYKAGDEKAAEAQLNFWQNSFELREIANITADRMEQIFARVQLHINELPGITKMRDL